MSTYTYTDQAKTIFNSATRNLPDFIRMYGEATMRERCPQAFMTIEDIAAWLKLVTDVRKRFGLGTAQMSASDFKVGTDEAVLIAYAEAKRNRDYYATDMLPRYAETIKERMVYDSNGERSRFGVYLLNDWYYVARECYVCRFHRGVHFSQTDLAPLRYREQDKAIRAMNQMAHKDEQFIANLSKMVEDESNLH